MTNNQNSTNQRKFLRVLPGFLVSFAALGILVFIVDWQEVISAISRAEYIYLLLGIPVYLIGYVLRALAWQTMLRGEPPFRDVFLTMQAGYLLNNMLPFRLGEFGRAFLLGRKGLGFWRVFSTIIIERAVDMILAAGLLLGTVPFVFKTSVSGRISYIVGGAILLGLLALHMLARNRDWVIHQYENLASRWTLLGRFGVQRVQAFINGLSALVQISRFLRVLIWMLSSWGVTVVYQYILLLAFEPSGRILWAAFGLATASMGVALPSSPSYVGVFEAAWVGALALFQVPTSSALAYALTAHVIHILISCLFGIYALAREGESLSHLYAEIRKQRYAFARNMEK